MNIKTGSQSSCFANVSFSMHAFQNFQLFLPTSVMVIGVKRRFFKKVTVHMHSRQIVNCYRPIFLIENILSF